MAMNFGDISIDFDKKQVCKNGNPVVLTALEYRLFAMLAKNSGKVLTREQILERIWDLSGNYVEDNTLTVYIKRLRKKLDTNMIKTVKGLGYWRYNEKHIKISCGNACDNGTFLLCRCSRHRCRL